MTDPRSAAFLRAICERPDDDAPRLIYADWLEENGQGERGEFIRVQIELSRLDSVGWHEQYQSGHLSSQDPIAEHGRFIRGLRHRERELLGSPCVPGGKTNNEWWFSPFDEIWIPRHVGVFGQPAKAISWEFSRGFVSAISLATDDFMRHAKAIFESQPVTSVRLTDKEPDFVDREPGFNPWAWHQERPGMKASHRAYLPFAIWWPIERGYFPTEEDAHAALSTACVSHGRSLAGLPPLASAVGAK